MRALRDCPRDVACVGKRAWKATLQEAKGGVALDVDATTPFALHLLDEAALMGEDERCDGLLIAETAPGGMTCFVELKGAFDPKDPDKPFRQVLSAIEHFAPSGSQSHGDDHHDAWRGGDDLPSAPRGRGADKVLAVAPEHNVSGLVVVNSGGTRHASRWVKVAGRDVFVAVVQKHGARGRVRMTLDEIERIVAT